MVEDLSSAQQLKQGLANKSRSFVPPVRLDISDGTVDGEPVVIARVHECDPSAKPCRAATSGKAYLRSYDGDFELSQVEEQGFLAARTSPHFDRRPVEGAAREDLDEELVFSFIRAVKDRDPGGLGRFRSDEELLRRAGVILDGGQPSVAGLLALGVYPQQFFPRYVIQAAAESRPGDPAGVRARNQMTITGPIPRMLDEAMAWARRTFDSVIVTEAGGMVVDEPEYPLVAFRELVANAWCTVTWTTGPKDCRLRCACGATGSLSVTPAACTGLRRIGWAGKVSRRRGTRGWSRSASTCARRTPERG